MKYFDPRSMSEDDLKRAVERGDIDAYERSDAGGIYKYHFREDGSIVIKDVEPADNKKGHQQTDFVVRDGCITSMNSHNDW